MPWSCIRLHNKASASSTRIRRKEQQPRQNPGDKLTLAKLQPKAHVHYILEWKGGRMEEGREEERKGPRKEGEERDAGGI